MMTDLGTCFLGLLIPFIGTTLGAACVFFLKDRMNPVIDTVLMGFAGGVMMAAAVWSLLIPSLSLASGMGRLSFIPAAAGFLLGIGFLLLLDRVVPHTHQENGQTEGPQATLRKDTMMMLAVTLHNIPEGMAVGVVLAGMLTDGSGITMTAAWALSLGIALQNFPEGAIISLPLKSGGMSGSKAFVYGMLSGVVEPIFGAITIILTDMIVPAMPYLLSFAAGAMVYVIVEELVPESSGGRHSDIGTIGFAMGFVLMMILDVTLG